MFHWGSFLPALESTICTALPASWSGIMSNLWTNLKALQYMPKYLLKPTLLNSNEAMTVPECCSSLGQFSSATHGFHSNWEISKGMKAVPIHLIHLSIYVRCFLNNANLACLNRNKLELIPGLICVSEKVYGSQGHDSWYRYTHLLYFGKEGGKEKGEENY